MMTEEQQAVAMQRMAGAIILAIEQNGGVEDMVVVTGALSAVVGAIAKATGRPQDFLDMTIEMSQGIVSGDLLNPLTD